MRDTLLDLMECPVTRRRLVRRRDGHGAETLTVEDNGENGPCYPIIDGIPRFVGAEDFVESFGFQWNRFDVRQSQEDEETLALKTGVALDLWQDKRVLDGGCGGGRYCRVAAEHGAYVVGVDRSRAVEKARALTEPFANVELIQADLTTLPLKPESFDIVFSIGVLHHSPDPKAAFESLAARVKPGGRLSVWVYRRNWWPQEALNNALRAIAVRIPRRLLLAACRAGAVLGAIPVVNRTLNKVVNFSNHPRWENRVCDTFDWYSPPWQWHHTPEEVINWFEESAFTEVRELPPAKTGILYQRAFDAGLIVGSGVNITGVRK